MPLTSEELKQIACEVIEGATEQLHTISHEIWSHPEECYQEHHAHKILTDYLETHDFPVQRKYLSETGFKAVYCGGSGPNISVLCEYDCLPDIGHACGHNLIAEAGIGAALGIQAALKAASDSGQQLGKVTVLGTPAEEGGGGKVDFVEAGEFRDIDAALIAHPSPIDLIQYSTTAVDRVTVRYHGKASHAAGFPWEGINALDAAVMAYNSISMLRQQMKPTWRIHGVIHNGGVKPNIIPELTELQFYARAPTVKVVQVLKKKANDCFKAAALATGCTVDIEWDPKPYENLICNPSLVALFRDNAASMGVHYKATEEQIRMIAGASTDVGNVCHAVPGIQSAFYIGSDAVNHTRPFNDAAGSDTAQRYTLIQAKAMAMTAIDVYCQPHLVGVMKAELQEALKQEEEES